MRGLKLRSCVALALVAGCASPPPPQPTAVIDSTPDEVCVGDGFATPITLSGERSAGRLSLVPAPPEPDRPLRFDWTLEGDEHRIVDGALDAHALTVRMAGARPLHVTLTVTAFEGGRVETLRTIGIVTPPPCGLGCADGGSDPTCCPDGMACDEALGGCLPAQRCSRDADCPACSVCDEALARCVPAERP